MKVTRVRLLGATLFGIGLLAAGSTFAGDSSANLSAVSVGYTASHVAGTRGAGWRIDEDGVLSLEPYRRPAMKRLEDCAVPRFA